MGRKHKKLLHKGKSMFKYMSLAVLAVATLATETDAERRRRPDGQVSRRRRFQRF